MSIISQKKKKKWETKDNDLSTESAREMSQTQTAP